MKKISLLLLALTACFVFYLNLNPPPPFFQSPSFHAYYRNLRHFALSAPPLSNQSQELYLQNILEFKPGSGLDNRKFFQTSLTQIRHLLKTDTTHDFANPIVRWMYLSNDLWDSITLKQNNPETIYTLEEATKQYHIRLKKSIEDPVNAGWFKPGDHSRDLHLFGNIPFPLFTMKNGTSVIRTPVPIINDSTVSPEFYAFLRMQQEEGAKHLYVNLMKMRKEEKPQTETIHSLEQDSIVGTAVTVITLDASSTFFWQEAPYADLSQASDFKHLFLQKMFSADGGYRWPDAWIATSWSHQLEELLDEVHLKHFQNANELTVSDRINFIQLATLNIIYKVCQKEKFQTMNVSCQHTLDRGGALLALLYYQETADSMGAISSSDFNRWSALITEVPPLLHNRSTHSKRASQIPSTLRKLYREQ